MTFGGQTHPADGSAAIVVTTRERARELASDPKIAVRLRGFGLARAEGEPEHDAEISTAHSGKAARRRC